MAGKKMWIQDAREKMQKKGNIGSFGKATPAKVVAAKNSDDSERVKKSPFAGVMKNLAAKRGGKG